MTIDILRLFLSPDDYGIGFEILSFDYSYFSGSLIAIHWTECDGFMFDIIYYRAWRLALYMRRHRRKQALRDNGEDV